MKFRTVISIDKYVRPVIPFQDERKLVDASAYRPYEYVIAEMLAKGEIEKSYLQEKASLYNTALDGSTALSIADVRGVDDFDIMTRTQKIREMVIATHKKALGEYKVQSLKDIESHYKEKYSKGVTDNPEQ